MTLDVLATGYPSFDYILPVSHSPGLGETALLEKVPDDNGASFGGCGCNVATGLARLGFQAGIAMILGDDYVGALYRSRLREQHIDDRDIIVMPRAQTSRSYLFLNRDGEYQNFFFAGASDQWQGSLRLRNVPGSKYALVTVGPYHYNKQFFQLAWESGTPTIWQLKPDIFAYPAEAMSDFASKSKYILMNRIEYAYVSKSMGLQNPEELLSDMTQAVVITRGAEGSQVYSVDGTITVAAVKLDKIVDVTGAGDAFAAGFLAGVLKDWNLQISARIGAVMASFVLQQLGCQTNLPSWKQMETRYNENFEPLPQ
ncbi:MAG: hypothetical protein H7175_09030 [Burkholderiales bacterium]|nr:hypothetical protein [Anaerolineae bacterium]